MYVGTPKRVLLVSRAMAIWIPPDLPHWMRYGANNVMQYVDVNREESAELGSDCRVIAMSALLKALFDATNPGTKAMRTKSHNEALYNLLRHELCAAADMPLSLVIPSDERVRRFAEAALFDPGKIRSVRTWLNGAAGSLKTIERVFVADTGMTPSQWLRHAKLLHAVSRLASGENVTSIALELGYQSPSAFSHMFRKTMGVSPRSVARDMSKSAAKQSADSPLRNHESSLRSKKVSNPA